MRLWRLPVLLVLALSVIVSGSRLGGADEPDEGPFRVRALRFEGVSGKGVQPDRLQWESVLLSRTDQGYVAPRAELPTEWIRLGKLAGEEGDGTLLFASALREIPTAVTRAYRRSGIAAVRATLKRSEVEALQADASDGVLRIHVTEGIVGEIEVRTRDADTEEVPEASEIESPAVDRIVRESPVKRGDLVWIEDLQDYTIALNRRTHRRVDIGLRPGQLEGEIDLQYLVTGVKPWTAYAQLSNTGTEETGKWRERLGWIHQNLSGRDDTLSFSFITAELDEANAATVSYEYPFSTVPWLSVRGFGLYSEYSASEVGAFNLDFEGETLQAELDLRGNFLQSGSLFADLVWGVQYHRIETDNELIAQEGRGSFVLLDLGIHVEQRSRESQLAAALVGELSLDGVEGTDRRDVERLGRTGAGTDWRQLGLELSGSRWLETFVPEPLRPESTQVHEVAWSLRGQHTFGSRVPPNFTHLNGGFYTVRGYPESFASGDRGLTATLEYRYHLPRALSPGAPVDLWGTSFRIRPERTGARPDWDLIFRAFVDAGRTEHEDRLSFERNSSLWGAGAGAELLVRRNLNLRLDWGIVLDDADNGTDRVSSGSNRLHFLLSVLF